MSAEAPGTISGHESGHTPYPWWLDPEAHEPHESPVYGVLALNKEICPADLNAPAIPLCRFVLKKGRLDYQSKL